MSDRRIALVTGGNRGIGLEVVRQLAGRGYAVVLVGRSSSRVEAAVEALAEEGLRVEPGLCDLAEEDRVARLCDEVLDRHGGVDVLVNNAAVIPDPGTWSDGRASAFKVPRSLFEHGVRNNVGGHYQLMQRLVPGMVEREFGRVVNLSSGMGAVSEMGGRFPAYRLSKAGMNVLTRVFAAEVGDAVNVKINSVCPGWVKTEMGGEGATREIPEGAAGVIWAATLPDDGPTGGFFRDGKPIPF